MGMKYLAGDFPEGAETSVMFGQPMLTVPTGNAWKPETHLLKEVVQSVEVMTEENKKHFLGKAAWGVVGLAALGPLGAIAGLFLGGNKKEICFICTLKNGKSFMATADSRVYQQLLAASFAKRELTNR